LEPPYQFLGSRGEDMGRGVNKAKRAFKFQFLNQCQKEIDRLTFENKALKEDPKGVVAPVLAELDRLAKSNERAAALNCALLTKFGDENKELTLTKDELEIFTNNRLQILWDEVDEGKSFHFKFIATPVKTEQASEASKPEEASQEVPEDVENLISR
jgi:hypothetical protein